MNVLIAEDETLAAERLQELLIRCEPGARVVDKVDSVEELSLYFSENKNIDLLLLDIQLSDGKSIELFDKVKVEVPIIFTTAYDQYALQAFQFHSIDYLLKPIEQEELCKAIEKFKKYSKPKVLLANEIEQLRNLFASSAQKFKERFLIKSGNKLQFKTVEETAYFYAEGKSVFLVTKKENRKYLVDYTLEELENSLDGKVFFRISRKFILSIDCIQEVKGLMGSRLEVKLNQPCDVDLTVSRDRVAEFKVWLDQ